jgi:cellulose synthase/poly-beta-1,6-N-acetylglucosamine synthase-like glycosyltransferase
MLTPVLTVVLAVLFFPLVVWWGLWLTFALLAVPPARPRKVGGAGGGTVVDILIPAHNEELLLPRLLETIRLQTAHHRIGHVLVVADHCADRTATLAREGHADVLERSSGPRGKPAALRDGLAWLTVKAGEAVSSPPPPRGILILDADCTVSPNLVEQCARGLDAGHAVLQAAYILDESRRPVTGGQKLHSAAFIAFALKNLIRPKGMSRLGLPCQLFGTGMCFRADVMSKIRFADHLTEDLAISYDLLLAGVAPRFLPGAMVRSPLPEDRGAMTTQKLRWETGQVHTWTKLPAMLVRLLSRGWLRSAVAVVDWSAPPVAMAVLYWVGATFAVVCAVALRWASPWVAAFPAFTIACLVAYVLCGGVQVAGIAAVARLFLAVPRFFFWKLALYAQMLAGRGPRSWQRTPRSHEPPAEPIAPLPAPGLVPQEAK